MRRACLLVPLALLLPLLGACRERSASSGDLSWTETTRTTRNGRLDLSVHVTDGDTSFLVSASGDALLAVEGIWDPQGDLVMSWEEWYDTSDFLSEAFYPWFSTTFFNWPIRAVDTPLSPGTWTVQLSGTDRQGYYTDTSMDVVIHTSRAPDPTSGTVRVRLVWADGVRRVDGLEGAVEAALDRWRRIWSPYGLTLEVEQDDARIDADLPAPGWQSSALLDVVEDSDEDQVTLVLGETVDGDAWTYGMAGGIPGSLAVSDRSAVAIAWLPHAGQDRRFTAEEERILGESMAHEVSHYLGLAHPVESTWDAWDALTDTLHCTSQSACEADMADHLMFPYPICSFTACQPQDVLTDGQVGIAQRFTGTL